MSIETEVVDLTHTAVISAVNEGLKDYLKRNLFGYNSPFDGVIKDAVSKMQGLSSLLQETVHEVIQEPEFKNELKSALRKRLVNELVKSFSLENTFKELRNDPATKARLVAALEGIAQE